MSLHMCEFEKNLGFILLITSSYINKFVNYYFIKSSDFMFNLGLQSKRDKSSVVFFIEFDQFKTFSLLFIFICLYIYFCQYIFPLSFFVCSSFCFLFQHFFFLQITHANVWKHQPQKVMILSRLINNSMSLFPNLLEVAENLLFSLM